MEAGRGSAFFSGVILMFFVMIFLPTPRPQLELGSASGVEVNVANNLDYFASLDAKYRVKPGEMAQLVYTVSGEEAVYLENVPVAQVFPIKDVSYEVVLRIQIYNLRENTASWSEPITVTIPGFSEALLLWENQHPESEDSPKRRGS